MTKRTRLIAILVAICTTLIATSGGLYLGALWLNSSPGQRGLFSLDIEAGMTASRIARTLHDERVIRSPRFFRLLARFRGYDRQIHAGTHWVDGNASANDILEQLLTGGVRIARITIPEGLTIRQMATIFAAELPFTEAEFIAAAHDSALVDEWALLGAPSMEGYLFPDTYHLDISSRPREVVETMAGRFREVFDGEIAGRCDSVGLTPHEVVTLASIVEKEAQVARERGIISQVFLKRLELDYKLGADPTVKYAMGNAGRRLSFRDIEIDSPYNTYLYPGLPPGPICSPGRGALEATVRPADTDFLYFVANWDGTHTFTRSLNQHVRAKRVSERRYQEWRREQSAGEASGGE